MQDLIISVMNQFGYLGIIFLIAIENIFPPIPSEVILTFGGFMTTYTNMSVMGVVIFSTVGSMLGAYVLYYVGFFLSPSRLDRLIHGRVGRILHLKMENIEKAQRWFDKKGVWTVFFCRFIPIVRSLISIPAGMMGMDIGTFSIFTTIGSLLWNLVLVSLGAAAGASWGTIATYVHEYSIVWKAGIAAAVLVLVVRIFHKRKQRKMGKRGE